MGRTSQFHSTKDLAISDSLPTNPPKLQSGITVASYSIFCLKQFLKALFFSNLLENPRNPVAFCSNLEIDAKDVRASLNSGSSRKHARIHQALVGPTTLESSLMQDTSSTHKQHNVVITYCCGRSPCMWKMPDVIQRTK